MKRIITKAWVFAGLALGLAAASNAAAVHRPNIVFILADDLGYTDVNAFAAHITGAKPARMFYETPNLDRLAREGTAFGQAYSTQLCSPTRAGLLTGRNSAKLGVMTASPATVRTYYNQGLTPPPGYLANDAVYWGDQIKTPQALLNASTLDALPSGQPLDQGRDETTIAEALTGYHSAFIGKWHLGSHGARGWQPHNQGFEELAYFDEGSSPYFDWRQLWDSRKKPFPKMPQPELVRGKTDPASSKAYLTEALTDTAIDFLKQQAAAADAKPFFLYLCHFAVHAPFQAKPEDVACFQTKSTLGWNHQSNVVYAAMVKSLDDSVGRVLQTLAQTGLESNTLVVFMSDNGGVTYTTPAATCNAPLKGGKAMLFEGGIRVPLVFRWPDHIPAAQWSDVPVTYEDIFPTLLDLVGMDPKPHYSRIDGRSLKPLFSDVANRKRAYPRDTFFWHYPFNVVVINPEDGQPLTPHSAFRQGDYKLIFDWSGRLLLYNLKNDMGEEHNLAQANPAKTKALFRELNRWLDKNVAVKYTPALNPDYDPAKEVRSNPFLDQRKALLGEKEAIRAAQSDPRLQQLLLDRD